MRNKKVIALILILCMVLSGTAMAQVKNPGKTTIDSYIDGVIPQMLQMAGLKGEIVSISDPVRVVNHPEEKMQLVLVGLDGQYVGALAVSELNGQLTSNFIPLENEAAQKALYDGDPFSVCYQDGAVYILTKDSTAFLQGQRNAENRVMDTGAVKSAAQTRMLNLNATAGNLRSWDSYTLPYSLVTTSNKAKTWAACLASCYNYHHGTNLSADSMITLIDNSSPYSSPFCDDYWIGVGYSVIGWSSCSHNVGSSATYELFYDTIITDHKPILLQFHFPSVEMVLLAYGLSTDGSSMTISVRDPNQGYTSYTNIYASSCPSGITYWLSSYGYSVSLYRVHS